MFVRTIDSLYVSINHYPQHVFVLLYNFLFMRNAFVFCLKKQDIFGGNAVLILFFISLIHSYVYIHIALCYQELYL